MAIFYPLESVLSHFTVNALRSMDHELVESSPQQHTSFTADVTARLLTMMLRQMNCTRKQCIYVTHIFPLMLLLGYPSTMEGWHAQGRDGCECAYIQGWRAEILKHNNVGTFLTYFITPLLQSNKMLEGTVSTPVKKKKSSYVCEMYCGLLCTEGRDGIFAIMLPFLHHPVACLVRI